MTSIISAWDDEDNFEPTTLGRLAAYYYLEHTSARLYVQRLQPNSSLEDLLYTLCHSTEYDELPVRHNEDGLNADFNNSVPYPLQRQSFQSPHTKTHLLLQAHFSRLPLPISDYITDTKSVLDQSIRLIQAMVDIAGDRGYLNAGSSCAIVLVCLLRFSIAIRTMEIMQMIMQGRWITDSPLLMLPHVSQHTIEVMHENVSPMIPHVSG